MEAFITSLTAAELKALIESSVQNSLKAFSFKRENTGDAEDVMTVEQAAKFVNLSVHTIYDKTSKQSIPHHKKGKKLYFVKSELKAWLLKDTKKETLEDLNKDQ